MTAISAVLPTPVLESKTAHKAHANQAPIKFPPNALQKILAEIYGNPDDPVHQDITAKMRIIKTLEYYHTIEPRDHDEEDMKNAMLGTADTFENSLYSTLLAMHNLKENLPELFAAKGYERDLTHLEGAQVLAKYGLCYAPPAPAKEECTVTRPLRNFAGDRLVFGTGESKVSDYTILPDAHDLPDMAASFFSKKFWRMLPANRFKEVIFEFGPDYLNRHMLKQTCRVLKSGGLVRFACEGVFTWAHKTDSKALADFFGTCGFSKFELNQETKDIVVLTK